jgi:peptide-methionine (S)-S-oxide reductase
MNTPSLTTQSIVLGGGCFWCLDAVYRKIEGVTSVVAGYAGGHVPNPDYGKVASKTSGHAEVIEVVFEPKTISLKDILDIFWAMHDPTTKDRQGYDVGPEYRSIILYQGEVQKDAIEESIKTAQKLFDEPITTEVKALDKFYEAEPEHQNFYKSGMRPDYCQIIIDPKLAKLRQKFTTHLRKEEIS